MSWSSLNLLIDVFEGSKASLKPKLLSTLNGNPPRLSRSVCVRRCNMQVRMRPLAATRVAVRRASVKNVQITQACNLNDIMQDLTLTIKRQAKQF